MKFALVGNQNSGKTTLFNRLTGSNQHVGNFPGVTVEKKEGYLKKDKTIEIVDLPGIYSFSPYTDEEKISRDFIIKEKPELIINIIDGTNLERNLYLTLQLMELKVPMVIALNMMDEIEHSGIRMNLEKLQNILDITIVPISASKNDGISDLITQMKRVAEEKSLSTKIDFCEGSVHKAVHSIAHIIEDKAKKHDIPIRYASIKMIEKDEIVMNELNLSNEDKDIINHIIEDMEHSLQTDREAALADMRYEFIEKTVSATVEKKGETKEQLRTRKIDLVLTDRIFGLPIFFCIMFLLFWLTFGPLGSFLSDLFASGVDFIIALIDKGLEIYGLNNTLKSFVVEGALTGVGSVLSFMPTILLLFFFLSLLEDSGYMARVAFVMDKLLRRIGLSGKSIVPMLIGFGCSVPAIMATRTLSSERDRKMTIMLIPFMSCSAKLPIYALFTQAFFQTNRPLVMMSLYLLGIVVAIMIGFVLKKTIFKGNSIPFIMELPAYRFPSAKSIGIHIGQRAKDFFIKAFTIIFISTIVIWIAQSFDFRFNLVDDSSNSILAFFGKIIAPIFYPLGFSDWRAATALLTGMTAKEAVVSTLSVLLGGEDTNALRTIFTPLAAYAFMIFTLLYTPCFAAVAAIKREFGSRWGTILIICFQLVVAWVIAAIFYNIMSLIF